MKFNLKDHPIIGMIHLPSLTGQSTKKMESIIEYTLSEAVVLDDLSYSGIMIENFNDSPFVKTQVEDEVLIRISTILHEVKKHIKIPIGVNLLRNACVQAMKVATVLDLSFIRCNIWESAYVTDQGIIEAAALDVINCKRNMNSDVKILADVHVKHAKLIGDFSVIESAENALERGKADQIIISGISTGSSPDLNKLKLLNEHNIKPIIGSGMSLENLESFSQYISGAIIGTSIKKNREVTSIIDKTQAEKFIYEWKRTFESFS
ncbi:MAG: putative sgc region protein SgcQ [Candidatus Heimdallarchaeota archaeon LC_2]|nr:MAG: putative sgc region protein SgcQ [Candidatus Heimdallarchaeota archaeon LC_2]